MNHKEYNGWTNYETWAVALWIDNDQGSYEYWREIIRDIVDGDEDEDNVAEELANRLKDEHDEGNPLAEQPSVYSDLMGAALSEVNWYEIAKNMLEE